MKQAFQQCISNKSYLHSPLQYVLLLHVKKTASISHSFDQLSTTYITY